MSDKLETFIHIQDGLIWIEGMQDGHSGIPISDWPAVRDEIDWMIADAKAQEKTDA